MGVVRRAGVGGANAAGTSPGVVEALLLSAVMGAAEKGWGFISDYYYFLPFFSSVIAVKTSYTLCIGYISDLVAFKRLFYYKKRTVNMILSS